MYVTEQLASFALELFERKAPEAQRDRVTLCLLDTLSAAVGGLPTDNARATRESMSAIFGGGNAPIWFTGERASLPAALVANCAAASALDIDDGHRGASGHAGAAIVPAVLTRAAIEDRWTGEELIAAILIGYEVALRIASSRQASPNMSYASGQWCAFGVAAALGVMNNLTENHLAHALAIAGADSPRSLPQGASINMGNVKGSSPWSSLVGLSAVGRAQCGFTGPIDMLNLEEFYDSEVLLGGLGQSWRIEDIYTKPYASCRYTHPVIDAVLALRTRLANEQRPPDSIVIEIFPEASKIPNARQPGTLEEAQFSIPYCAALAWLRGGSAFRPMKPDSLSDADVLRLAGQVDLQFSNKFEGWFPGKTPASVNVRFGRNQWSETVENPLGDPANPMSRTDLNQKLIELSIGRLERDNVKSILVGAATIGHDSSVLFEAIR